MRRSCADYARGVGLNLVAKEPSLGWPETGGFAALAAVRPTALSADGPPGEYTPGRMKCSINNFNFVRSHSEERTRSILRRLAWRSAKKGIREG